MGNPSISEVYSYLSKTIDEKPPDKENIRIVIWDKGVFIQYLDVPREFSDKQITEFCQESFSLQICGCKLVAPVQWEHFSCPERYTGLHPKIRLE